VAAGEGQLAIVEKLLAANADINAAATDRSSGLTALQAAAKAGHLAIVEKLLAANADVNAAATGGSGGRTALEAAAEKGYLNVVEKLLSANADANATGDGRGWTRLLRKATSRSWRDCSRRTPISIPLLLMVVVGPRFGLQHLPV